MLSSICTLLPGPGEEQPGAQPPCGGQAGGCCPCWMPPASLEERRCRAPLASFLSREVREERFFPQQVLTGLAQSCPKEIWQKCPPASYSEETGSVSLSPLRHWPPGLLRTKSLFLCLRPDAAETFLHPGALTCQRISASRPQAKGGGFGIAKPQLFQQRQAMTSPSTQSRNGSRGEADTSRVGSTSTSLPRYQSLGQGSAALAPPQSTQTEGLGLRPGLFTLPEDAPRRHRQSSNNALC